MFNEENMIERLYTASEILEDNLKSIENITRTFTEIIDLRITYQAKDVSNRISDLFQFYSWETFDESGGWPTMDMSFEELSKRLPVLNESIDGLDRLFEQLKSIYINSILKNLLVMLVGALEVFFRSVFESSNLQVNNYQNIMDIVKRVRRLTPELIFDKNSIDQIWRLQQKRHVLIHKSGEIDAEYCKKLKLDTNLIGKQVDVKEAEIDVYINAIRKIKNQLISFLGK